MTSKNIEIPYKNCIWNRLTNLKCIQNVFEMLALARVALHRIWCICGSVWLARDLKQRFDEIIIVLTLEYEALARDLKQRLDSSSSSLVNMRKSRARESKQRFDASPSSSSWISGCHCLRHTLIIDQNSFSQSEWESKSRWDKFTSFEDGPTPLKPALHCLEPPPSCPFLWRYSYVDVSWLSFVGFYISVRCFVSQAF